MKLAHTDYHADAAMNGWNFYPCATFKDTLTSGSGMQSLMGRLAATRRRVEFNGDLQTQLLSGCLTTGKWMKGGSPRMLVDTFGRPDMFC